LIFSLPFHIPRFFRPTFIDVFRVTNTQLGDIFAVYGIVALLCYFPGGILADRFAPRKLMFFSLIATAIGGLYLATIPQTVMLYYLFGYWGCTSVLLFWAAMIKQTRVLAGEESQGLAFGLLDGGRGLVASLVASIAVVILAMYMHSEHSIETFENKQQAMTAVILFYSLMTCVAAVLIWLFLPSSQSTEGNSTSLKVDELITVAKDKKIWLQGGIIICAYCGYKALDNYGLYATQILQMSQVDAASLTASASFGRPIAALLAGLLADKWHTGKSVLIFFVLTAFSFTGMMFLQPETVIVELIVANIVLTFVAVYALRGIYFALIEQSKLKLHVTGAAVGLISLIGYTPDIFFSSITGRILDANPGFIGFQNYFLFLVIISIVGVLLIHWLNRLTNKINLV
jgi:nitrate/nitrite transporter NarK